MEGAPIEKKERRGTRSMPREFGGTHKTSGSVTKSVTSTDLYSDEEGKTMPKPTNVAVPQRKKKRGVFKSRTITEGVMPNFIQPWSDFADTPKAIPPVIEEGEVDANEQEEAPPIFRSARRGVVGSDAGLNDRGTLKQLVELMPILDEVRAVGLADHEQVELLGVDAHRGRTEVLAAAM